MSAANPKSRRLLLWLAIGALVCATPFLAALYLLVRAWQAKPDFERIVRWIDEQKLRPGTYDGLKLPSTLAPASANGTIDLVIGADGRKVFLLKTSIGWKGNYEGFVYCSAPLKAGEIGPGYGERDMIYVEGSIEAFIDAKIDEHLYSVFFDLG